MLIRLFHFKMETSTPRNRVAKEVRPKAEMRYRRGPFMRLYSEAVQTPYREKELENNTHNCPAESTRTADKKDLIALLNTAFSQRFA